jgi:DNA-binding transcriptional ArsR family regulator
MEENPEPSELFRILGARRRLAIIRILRHHGPIGAKRIADILGVTPAAVSQHLKALRHAGLVMGERHGYHVPYSLNEQTLSECCSEINRACGVHRFEPPEDDLEELLRYRAMLEKKLALVRERIEELKDEG